MASVRITVTLDAEIAAKARTLGVNLAAAAREGVARAVRRALAESDRRAYERQPETADSEWADDEAWADG